MLACLAATVVVSAAAPRTGQGLPELPVTRIEGGGTVTQNTQKTPPPPQTQKPAGLPPLPVTQLERAAAQLDGPATLTMNFPKPLPVRDVLQVLVAETPFSVIVAPDVTATFQGELKDVTMRQALESVLVPLELDYALKDSVIHVFARRPATRLFDLNVVDARRAARRAIRSATAPHEAPAGAELTSASEADILDELTRGVQTLLSAAGRMHVDRKAGLLTVTDFADRLEEVGVYVEAVQLRSRRQVRLEAQVLEVTMTDAAASRIDWPRVYADAGVQSSSAIAGIKPAGAKALLEALAKQGAVRTIAAPQVLAMNNEPAFMRVGTQEITFRAASAADGDRDAALRTGAVFAGLTLTVVAQIGADGIVHLSVSPTYAEKTGEAKTRGGAAAPVLAISEADTVARVHGGDTVLIAGLLRDRDRVVKATGVAGLFGGETREAGKSELVILLTPTIVVPGVNGATGTR